MKQLVIGSLLAAAAMFVFGAAFWMSPLPYGTLGRTAQGDAAAGAALLQHFPATGTYILPGIYNDEEILNKLYQSGPIATLHITREGRDAMSPKVFLFGYLHMLATVLLIAVLLRLALPALGSYGLRVGFVVAAGLAAAVFSQLGEPVWWHHPWPWHLWTALYIVGAWSAAGLVLAAFLKPVR